MRVRPPFALAFGSSFFERKAAQPETLQRFGLAMSSWSSGDGAHQMVTCYDWGSLPAGAKVVDVGGALGHISLAIADAFPGLEFVVEDQAPLAQQARELIVSYSESVSERVKFLHGTSSSLNPSKHRTPICMSSGISRTTGPTKTQRKSSPTSSTLQDPRVGS
jgi:hypothetical protein